MANQKHLEILRQGVDVWNKWREDNPDVVPDLQEVNLQGADLQGISLQKVNLQDADLRGIKLQFAKEADILQKTNFRGADLQRANFQGADLRLVYLQGAKYLIKYFVPFFIGANTC
ncbi:MAG: pentapeptide repeat-containing protein [Desulfobacteraceae bacterium]|nr:pentapeptide repeat-containing protein [Desulfobacteraceae bacterium]